VPGSAVGIATAYGLDGPGIEFRCWARFSAPVQTGPEAHTTSCKMGTGSFPGVRCGRGVTLTPDPLLTPSSKIEYSYTYNLPKGLCSLSHSETYLQNTGIVLESSWNLIAHGDARQGKWRGNWRMEWVASTLHTTSEHGHSSITTKNKIITQYQYVHLFPSYKTIYIN
jgi:hypothetical protein